MLSYTKVQSKPRVLQSLAGLSMSEFEQLLVSFERAWQDYLGLAEKVKIGINQEQMKAIGN